MAEYLSPGVYVEEFDSGSKPMEGVSTSTAGFVGVAERGMTVGVPQLVTNFADYKRKYGGYLSENEYGNYRFLSYAVEQFFANGGSRCYIMRVAPESAKCAEGYFPSKENPLFKFTAKNPGEWGNRLQITIKPADMARTQVLEEPADGSARYRVKKAAGFHEGDIVEFRNPGGAAEKSDSAAGNAEGETKNADSEGNNESGESGSSADEAVKPVYNRVTRIQDNFIEFEKPFDSGIADTNPNPQKVLVACGFSMEIRFDDISEAYENLSLNENEADYIVKRLEKSDLVSVGVPEMSDAAEKDGTEKPADGDGTEKPDNGNSKETDSGKADPVPPFERLAGDGTKTKVTLTLENGANGSVSDLTPDNFNGDDKGAGKRSGIEAFKDNDTVSIMAVPGVTDLSVQLNLVTHCENLASRFAVLDMPRDLKKTDEIEAYRDIFDSTYAALYHPWLTVYDPLDKRNIAIPPSGSVIGIYARSDNERGVHKAPANEVVKNCVGLDCNFNKGEQDILNPKGVNLIRAFPGRGIRVWGARTVSSDGSWKYVNVRRLFIYIEESIKANTNWVVFEPNDETLWVRVKRTIEVFLTGLWRNGYLAGTSTDEAFYVNVGPSTMSQSDIDNGRLICVIGVAPVKPAEFVIFRLTQKTGDSE